MAISLPVLPLMLPMLATATTATVTMLPLHWVLQQHPRPLPGGGSP